MCSISFGPLFSLASCLGLGHQVPREAPSPGLEQVCEPAGDMGDCDGHGECVCLLYFFSSKKLYLCGHTVSGS